MMDYSLYPPTWKTVIRPAVLSRAGNCCEHCGVENHRIGYRLKGVFIPVDNIAIVKDGKMILRQAHRLFKIVLTIAHLDHDPENWDVSLERLAALCQKCHLNYDQAHHTHTKATRKYHGTLNLFQT